MIYVCDSGSDTISVIDGSTNTVINTIFAGGNFPNVIALDALTNRLYVGFSNTNTINEINTVTKSVVADIPVGTAENSGTMNMVSDLSHHLFVSRNVAYLPSQNITSIDALGHYVNNTAYEFPSIKTTTQSPYDYVISAMTFGNFGNLGKSQLFVNLDSTVYVFEWNDYSDGLVLDDSFPINETLTNKQDIASDPSNDLIYIANYHNSSVSVIKEIPPVISTKENAANARVFDHQFKIKVIGKIPIPPHTTIPSNPDGIAVNPETHKIYVMDSESGFVYAIDGKCMYTAGDIKKCNSTPIKVGGGRSSGIAVNPNTKEGTRIKSL